MKVITMDQENRNWCWKLPVGSSTCAFSLHTSLLL